MSDLGIGVVPIARSHDESARVVSAQHNIAGLSISPNVPSMTDLSIGAGRIAGEHGKIAKAFDFNISVLHEGVGTRHVVPPAEPDLSIGISAAALKE